MRFVRNEYLIGLMVWRLFVGWQFKGTPKLTRIGPFAEWM